ncbi:DUF397 domain-containing protein [Spirillospora sp. CA-294931]|uniref:DUF397 domain-containing protein n=1 Tax=Spirillospora sp. CA-294931 TaxID=3240042 RepID=UPI003D8E6A28
MEDLKFRKSSYTTSNGGDCVELAPFAPAAVAVRDSKDPGGPMLVVRRAALAAAIEEAVAGRRPR